MTSPVAGAADRSDAVDMPARERRAPADVAAARRLAAHARASALGADRNTAFDRLAAIAARLLGTTSAQIVLDPDVPTLVGSVHLTSGAAGAVGAPGCPSDPLRAIGSTAGGPIAVSDARTDQRTVTCASMLSDGVVAYVGVPLVTDAGHTVGTLSVFDPVPRDWSPDDAALLAELAAAVVAQLELNALTGEYAASRTRWELAIDAAAIGTFDWDLVTGRLSWDDRLVELFGYNQGTFDESIESFRARVHPEDLDRAMLTVQETIERCGEYEAEYRIVHPGGHVRWIQARGRALSDGHGTAVRMLGAAYDVTAAREGDAKVTRVLESMSGAFVAIDESWRFSYVNKQAEMLLGLTREQLLDGDIWEMFPGAIGSEFEAQFRRAMNDGESVTFEAYYGEPLNAWLEIRAWPGPDGLSVHFVDITDRRAAQEQAMRNAQRATLLAQVASELAGTLDAEEAVARLARLVVPSLADWCIVTLVDDDEPGPLSRRLRDIGSWHRDPALRAVVARYTELRRESLVEGSHVARAVDTGRPVVLAGDATEAIARILRDGEARELLTGVLRPETAKVLPLRAHGRTLGLLTLFRGHHDERAPEDDIDAALEVAARAGLALDSARLYDQQRRLSEGLQRSLLTAPPEPDHLQVIVRYEPAAQAAQVGGDWYDAFVQPGGETVLVIGDVVGHDFEAAAAMGQVRGLLRGIAATTGDGPANVLTRLDAAMALLDVGTTASAVVARFEQTPDERARGVARMRWSNAGHPPPMAVNPDGSVLVLSGIEADLLLGIDAHTVRTEAEVTLDRGATVLLYTDGLVERRDQSLDVGLGRLRENLLELGHEGLDEMCDEILVRMLPARSEDDVALAAVRLHRQDRPRPAEAGPNRLPEPLQ